MRARLDGGTLTVWLAARTREALDAAERTLRDAMPPLVHSDDRQETNVSFWTYTGSGPWQVVRRVAVPGGRRSLATTPAAPRLISPD